jgi:hypothetical protein
MFRPGGGRGMRFAQASGSRSAKTHMIDPQPYNASPPSLSGQSRTAGIVPGLALSPSPAKSTQETETSHFSRLVDQAMTARACGEPARTAGSMPVACDDTKTDASATTAASGTANTAGQTGQGQTGQGQGHGGFLDFILGILDVINPLQHIPVISTLYRHLTGDEISPMAQVAGDTLYGGPIGGALSLANVATKAETGHDIGDHMLAMVTGEKLEDKVHTGRTAPPQVMLAQNDAPRQKPEQVHESDIVWNNGAIVPQAAAAPEAGDIPALSDRQLARLMSRPAATAAAKAASPSSPKAPLAALQQKRNAPHNFSQGFRMAGTAQAHGPYNGLTGRQLASYTASRAAPAPFVKSGSAAAAVLMAAQETGTQETGTPPQTSAPVFQAQDARAENAATAVPPGLIASRMMAALDKYSAMNRLGAGLPGPDRGLAAAN